MRAVLVLALVCGCRREDADPAPSPSLPARRVPTRAEIEATIAAKLLERDQPTTIERVQCPDGDLLALDQFECLATYTGASVRLVIEGKPPVATWTTGAQRYVDHVRVSTHGDLSRLAASLYRAPRRFDRTVALDDEAKQMIADKVTDFMRVAEVVLDRVECPAILASRPAECVVESGGKQRPFIIFLLEERRGNGLRRTLDGGWKLPGQCTDPDPLDPDRCYLDGKSFTGTFEPEIQMKLQGLPGP